MVVRKRGLKCMFPWQSAASDGAAPRRWRTMAALCEAHRRGGRGNPRFSIHHGIDPTARSRKRSRPTALTNTKDHALPLSPAPHPPLLAKTNWPHVGGHALPSRRTRQYIYIYILLFWIRGVAFLFDRQRMPPLAILSIRIVVWLTLRLQANSSLLSSREFESVRLVRGGCFYPLVNVTLSSEQLSKIAFSGESWKKKN